MNSKASKPFATWHVQLEFASIEEYQVVEINARRRPKNPVPKHVTDSSKKSGRERCIYVVSFEKDMSSLASYQDSITCLPPEMALEGLERVRRPEDSLSFVVESAQDLSKDFWVHMTLAQKQERYDECRRLLKALTDIRRDAMTKAGIVMGTFPVQVIVSGAKGKTLSFKDASLDAEMIKCVSLQLREETPQKIANFLNRHYSNRTRKITDILSTPQIGLSIEVSISLLTQSLQNPGTADEAQFRRYHSLLQDLLGDAHGALRRHLQNMYNTPNVMVLPVTSKHGHSQCSVIVELRPLDNEGLRKLQKHLDEGQLGVFVQDTLCIGNENFLGQVTVTTNKNGTLRDETAEEMRKAQVIESVGVQQLKSLASAYIFQSLLKNPTRTPFEFLKLLEDNGCPGALQYIRDNRGYNALHLAVAEKRSDFMKMLLYRGDWGLMRQEVTGSVAKGRSTFRGYTPRRVAEVDSTTSEGQRIMAEFSDLDETFLRQTILDKACLRGRLDLVRIIAEGDPHLVPSPPEGCMPNCLSYAAASGSVDVFEYLLKKGVHKVTTKEKADSYAHVAAMSGRLEILRSLSEKKFNIKGVQNADGLTALDYAAINGDLKTLQYFCSQGFKPNVKTLISAVQYAKAEVVDYLIQDFKLDLNTPDEEGCVALHQAAVSGDVDTLSVLMKYKADITIKNMYGQTAFHIAADSGHTSFLRELIQAIHDPEQVAQEVQKHDIYSSRDLCYLIRGRDRGKRAWHWVELRPLHFQQFRNQMSSGQIDVAQHGRILFSGFGASPGESIRKNLADMQKKHLKEAQPDKTPLHHAAHKGSLELVQVLLEAGADPNAMDYFGAYSAHYAAMRGNLDILNLLVQFGADLDRYANDGFSIRDIAEANNHEHVVNYVDGYSVLGRAKTFVTGALQAVTLDLGKETLEAKRNEGKDIKRHTVDALRALTIEINGCLLGLGSAPITEASRPSSDEPPYEPSRDSRGPSGESWRPSDESGFDIRRDDLMDSL